MLEHIWVAEFAWNVGYIPLGGIRFQDVPLVEFMYFCIYTHTMWELPLVTQVFIVVLALHILSLTPLCVDFPLFLKIFTKRSVVYRARCNIIFR